MDAATVLMLLCVGAVCAASCLQVVRALAVASDGRSAARQAVLWTGAYSCSVIGCLALADLSGRGAAAVLAAVMLAGAAGLSLALGRRWREASEAERQAFCEARALVERASAAEPAPLDNATLCMHLARAFDLTRREEEVAVLLLDGSTQAELPQKLCVSENTVKTHVRHIYRKLGVRSREQLFEKAAALRAVPSNQDSRRPRP